MLMSDDASCAFGCGLAVLRTVQALDRGNLLCEQLGWMNWPRSCNPDFPPPSAMQ